MLTPASAVHSGCDDKTEVETPDQQHEKNHRAPDVFVTWIF